MQEWLEMREVPVACAGLGPDSYLAKVCRYTHKLHHAIPPKNAFAGLAFTFPIFFFSQVSCIIFACWSHLSNSAT